MREPVVLDNFDVAGWARYLCRAGLTHGSAGNLSARRHGQVVLTPIGSFFDFLSESELVTMDEHDAPPPDATTEAAVHLAIYRARPGVEAVIHVHPPHVVALSILCPGDEIVALDEEAHLYFGGRMPIVDGPSGSAELAARVAEAVTRSPVVVVRRHGLFVAAKDFSHGAVLATSAEHSARVRYLVEHGAAR